MHARLVLVVALTGTIAITRGLQAQSAQPYSIQGSVLAAGQNLNDGLVLGVGFEGQLRYAKGVWSVGLGYQTSKHTAEDEFIKISGFFLEPRRAFDIGSSSFAPYIAGRVATPSFTIPAIPRPSCSPLNRAVPPSEREAVSSSAPRARSTSTLAPHS
jgi:hypothetical protein